MRTIVHFGMPKSGSTALQKGLSRGRASLLEQGILYPRVPIVGPSHNILMMGLVPPDNLPRFVRHSLQKAGKTSDLFDHWIAALGESLTRSGAHTLVLSAENLWALTDPAPAARLRDLLQGLGATRIEAVAYLRRPSDWYLSMMGQILTASHRIKPATAVSYRPAIEAMAATADPDAVRLHVYDRGTFPGGDILAHFLQDTLSDVTLPDAPPREANVTLSAEGLDLLRGYRAALYPGENGRFTPDTGRVLAALERAEAVTPGHARPRLKPPVAEMLDQGAPDLIWMRDVHGVTFDGIDHDALATEPWSKTFDRIDRICPIDLDRREQLQNHAFRELAQQVLEAKTRRKGKGKGKAKTRVESEG